MTDPGTDPSDSSDIESDALGSPAATVREILDEARRIAGSGPRLAARLEELGIGPPDTNRYSESAISNWIRGRTMPPADVLVAASLIAGKPLARPGSAAGAAVVLDRLEDIEGLQQQVDALRAAVIDLYGRLGFPMPNLDNARADSPGRAAAIG
jgi:hypothetical protein